MVRLSKARLDKIRLNEDRLGKVRFSITNRTQPHCKHICNYLLLPFRITDLTKREVRLS
jgi:hypothetical protein